MKKILILSVSAGHGHTRAAEALVAGADRWFPGQTEMRHIDVMELVPSLFRKAYSGSYIKFVNKYPRLWGFIYSRTDRDQVDGALNSLRRRLESLVSNTLVHTINEFKPDIIISTHFLPGQVIGGWRRSGRIAEVPHWIVVTDFVAHRYWLEPGQTGYFAATEESAFGMRYRKLVNEKIIVSGIPIMPEFSDAISRDEGAAKFNLDPDRTTVLLMGGGEGVGSLKNAAFAIAELEGDFQLAVLAGKNWNLKKELEKAAESYPAGRIKPLGYTTYMGHLLAASDLVVSKSGGLTTCECLARGKPMLVISPIPGQEEANADYLLENGAALKTTSLPSLVYRVNYLLNNQNKLAKLGRRAKSLGRPLAAKAILEEVLA